MKRLFLILFQLFLILAIAVSNYVDASAKQFHVPTALSSIQEAIKAANNEDVIMIHPHIYYEKINFMGKAIKIVSIDPNDPNVVESTIICGILEGNVVTFDKGEDLNSELRGITIMGNDYLGCGIYCNNASPTIKQCTVMEISNHKGGGIYCSSNSCPKIDKCIIAKNSANIGGGIYCCDSSPIIIECIITKNSTHKGGGIYCNPNSCPEITKCTITQNTAYLGGGIYCCASSSIIIRDCNITNNVNYTGGGIYCDINSSPKVSKCIITENSAYKGGGVHCCPSSSFINNGDNDIADNLFFYGNEIYHNPNTCPTATHCQLDECD